MDRVLINDGHGRFPAAYNLGSASDLKLVYLNDGTGHFHVGSTYGSPDWPMRNARHL